MIIPEGIKVTSEKPRAIVYIDDKALRFTDWDQCLTNLESLKVYDMLTPEIMHILNK